MKNTHLIFPHIPKTAGTSVRRNVKEAFEQGSEPYVEVAVYDMPGNWVSTKAFESYDLPRNWDFIYGHATMEQFLKNAKLDPADKGITCLSFLRDPIDRCISVYNYIATTPTHRLHKQCLASEPQSFLRMIVVRDRNLQHRYLACRADVKWTFLIASSNRVGQTCAEAFERVTGKDLGKDFFDKKFNVTKKFSQEGQAQRMSRDSLDAKLLAEYYDLNDLDRRMFELVSDRGVMHENPVWAL